MMVDEIDFEPLRDDLHFWIEDKILSIEPIEYQSKPINCIHNHKSEKLCDEKRNTCFMCSI